MVLAYMDLEPPLPQAVRAVDSVNSVSIGMTRDMGIFFIMLFLLDKLVDS